MERRLFINRAATLAAATFALPLAASEPAAKRRASKEIYEWRRYSFNDAASLDQFHAHCKSAWVPALKRLGVGVGAFVNTGGGDPLVLHVWLIFKDIETYQKNKDQLFLDKKFTTDAADFFATTAKKPLYKRFETFLLEGFEGFPQLVNPGKEKRFFELRIYDSPNEEAGQRKLHMFNNGEFDIFAKVDLSIVFAGEILAGPSMPGLIYMLAYKDKEARDAGWAKFGPHPDWKVMSQDPFYANTVSKVNSGFMLPTDYSDF